MTAKPVAGRLAEEILRKLRLATDAESKDDRETVCSEIFADVTGLVDDNAAEKLRVPSGTRFYEVLALFFDQHADVADDVLHVCRRLWGQPYIAPVYALLLHRWLLMHPSAGGQEQRQKHTNVLISGARQLFWGDVQSSNNHFEALYSFLADRFVFSKGKELLDQLPTQSRAAMLSVVASFLPYYNIPQGFCSAMENMPVPGHIGGHVPGEGTDFVLTEVTDTLQKMKSRDSLLRYLSVLLSLRRSPYVATARKVTRLRLQAELYHLTSSGGPRYLPRAVNQAAFDALDALFPFGRRSRRLINVAFKFLHPSEWGWALIDAYRSGVDAVKAWFRFAFRSALSTIDKFNPMHAFTRQYKRQ